MELNIRGLGGLVAGQPVANRRGGVPFRHPDSPLRASPLAAPSCPTRRCSPVVVCQAGKKKGGKKSGKAAAAAGAAAATASKPVPARPRGGNLAPDHLDAGISLANNITPLGGGGGGGLAVSTAPSGRRTLHALQRCRTLVLDCSYRPIDVVNWQRAVCLDIFDKADVLEYYDQEVRASRESYPVPAVVRVRFFLKQGTGQLPCVRRYILIRDDFSCQYCGSTRNLSMDHVHPVSLGGTWSWENLVTCCMSCNSRKGSKTLKELGWKLRKQPKAPSAFQMEVVNNMTASDIRSPPPEWSDYLRPEQLQNMYPSR